MTDLIRDGDFVYISGGGGRRIAEVKHNVKVRLGRSGAAETTSLIGMRWGEVVALDHNGKRFVVSNDYPDLDISDVTEAGEERDNRNLVDNNDNQGMTNEEVAAMRKEKGLDELLSTLKEKSSTFHTKTEFSQEKYLRKKQKKYGTLFKLERVVPDTLAETHLPTINPSDEQPEDARCIRLRADTVALILHHSDVHSGSRVLLYDQTNGVLPAYVLTRLGTTGQVFQVLDRNGQPNTFTAAKVMGLPDVKERWKAVPRNPGFLEGVEDPASERAATNNGDAKEAPADKPAPQRAPGPTQWVKGLVAREALQQQPADSLIVVDDEDPSKVLADLLPFVASGGHIVVYSPFLEDLSSLFVKLRNQCVNIRISETWYRFQQVLPHRTHPTVNMSTAAGYLLTAVKVEQNPNPRPRFAQMEGFAAPATTTNTATVAGTADASTTATSRKRGRSSSPAATDSAPPA